MKHALTDDYFEYIYTKNKDNVYKITYSILKNADEAQDAVQETFIKFHRYYNRTEKLKTETELAKWLSVIAKHEAINIIKKKPKYSEYQDGLCYGQQIDLESLVEQRDTIEALDHAIDKLNSNQAETIRLKYYVGFTPKEISVILDIPLPTVYSHLRVGIKKIKKIYKEMVKNEEK